jgi:type IV pilus assembly protein PilC
MPIDLNQIKQTKKKEPGKQPNTLLDFLQKDISFGKKGLSDKYKERFYSELSVLINSGIDLASSLEIIAKQEKNKKNREIFSNLLEQLIKGESFSAAMQNSGMFSGYEYYSVMIGEESGTLPRIITEMALHYKTRLKQKRQITGALTYPALVMFVAIVAVAFMLNVIVPMFAGVFQRFGGELPAITQKVMNISEFFSNNIFTFCIAIFLLILAAMYVKKYEFYRKYSTILLLKLPVFGELARKIYLSRFCNTLQLLVASRAPIIEALDLIGKMIRFYPLNTAIDGIKYDLTHGKTLNESMLRYPIFDTQLVSLIKVGEETGKLEQILQRLNEQYTEDIQYRTGQMGNLLEPLLIIGVGAMVLVILIAMYLPLFQLSTSII